MNTATPFLTAEQMNFFRKHGYLALSQISSSDEVAALKDVLYRLFEERTGWEQGAQFDMASADDGRTPPLSPQIIDPVAFAPELKETQFRRNAMAIARELLGVDVQCSYEHAIYKPRRFGSATPWHQDEAFSDSREMDYDSISVWMPLQDVTSANGCLQFIPGSHLGEVLNHRSLNNDPRIHGLECDAPFDRSAAVVCPLPAGGATVHHCRTLHAAEANKSGNERCAYVLTFKKLSQSTNRKQPYPWNVEKRTARQARREQWRHRGGLLGRLGRKLKKLLSRSQ